MQFPGIRIRTLPGTAAVYPARVTRQCFCNEPIVKSHPLEVIEQRQQESHRRDENPGLQFPFSNLGKPMQEPRPMRAVAIGWRKQEIRDSQCCRCSIVLILEQKKESERWRRQRRNRQRHETYASRFHRFGHSQRLHQRRNLLIIKNGHEDMPPEGQRIKPGENWDLVNYERSLAKKKPDSEQKPQQKRAWDWAEATARAV